MNQSLTHTAMANTRILNQNEHTCGHTPSAEWRISHRNQDNGSTLRASPGTQESQKKCGWCTNYTAEAKQFHVVGPFSKDQPEATRTKCGVKIQMIDHYGRTAETASISVRWQRARTPLFRNTGRRGRSRNCWSRH